MTDYSIENLIKTFTKHAEQSKKDKIKQIADYKLNYPDSPLPAHFKDDFNIAIAFREICKAIRKLQGFDD